MNTRETLITELNVLEHFDPIIPAQYQGTEFLMLGNLSPIVQRQVIERLTVRPKLIVMDTMNFWMDIMMDELKKTIALVDVLTINEEEAQQLSGKRNIVEAAEAVMAMGPSTVIIKKGEHGALLFGRGGQIFATPAMPLRSVFDPTGAGDSFAGGFIGYLASKGDISFESMKKAVIAGSVIASFCVEKFGTERLVNLPQADISKRVEAFIQLSQFGTSL
jgi:sugar/nucleoside kinase (ribokinase family)